ncbi:YciI family protein [Agromyces sp. CFH 90414]|uniref:YciI family protein n=1 Tax=Agromyces agglutinans TaxID=2662258 RepID=A0A6I2F6A0_9MICO|nr:YciI family protein [Agromyces agglutinans]MRG60232.1 YciI family protein [Agromyces agglutinans]
MRYTLLLHYSEESPESLGEEALAEGMRRMAAFAATLHDAGVLLSAEVLQPSETTTTLRRDADRLQVQDGPFVDAKVQLGGTIVIDVPDLDAALEWASQAPALDWGGVVEVRPGAVHTVDGSWVPNR